MSRNSEIDEVIQMLNGQKPLPDKPQMEKEIQAMVKNLGFSRILQNLMRFAQPKTISEATVMVTVLQECLSTTLAWEGFLHIDDHDGYDCAKQLIERTTHDMKRDADNNLAIVLELRGKEPVEKSINQQTCESILKEIEENG